MNLRHYHRPKASARYYGATFEHFKWSRYSTARKTIDLNWGHHSLVIFWGKYE